MDRRTLRAVVAAAIGGILYRLRGGVFSNLSRRYGWEWGGKQRTQLMRTLWSLPFAGLIYYLVGGPWWVGLALCVSVFAGLALWGHGAHMVMAPKEFVAFSKNKTELLTSWWLPEVFGGIPDSTWPLERVQAYNIVGMSWIGFVRNTTSMLPLFGIEPTGAIIYAFTGTLHGFWYWLGWRVNEDSAAGEVITGAMTWALIVVLFG